MCGSNWASYIPYSQHFTFFHHFLWNPASRGISLTTGFHFWGGVMGWNSSYTKRVKWNPQGPRVGYVRRQIWTTHYTHFKEFCLEKIFWKSSKSLNYWKERCFKKSDFWGSFWKSLCKIVTNNAFLIFFFLNRSKFDVESDCDVRFLKQRE